MNIRIQKKKFQKSHFDQINANIQKSLTLVLKFIRHQIFDILNNYFKSFRDEIETKKII